MKEFWKKYGEKVILIVVSMVIFTAALSVVAIFCGAVMKLFGFSYHSPGSAILFFIIAAVISCPLNLLVSALIGMLFSLGRLPRPAAVLLYIVWDAAATALGLSIVDYYMESVSASPLSVIVISFLLSLPGGKEVGANKKEE